MRVSLAAALFLTSLALSGCSLAPVLTSNSGSTGAVQGATISGRVHGGQTPIQGAHVYLLAVTSSATSTYGGPGIPTSSTNAATSLLTSGAGQDSLGYYVTTDSGGNFSITGDYSCPSAYAHPYLLATGGYPGSGTSNSAISLVGLLSTCPTGSEFVVINEVSTVAAAYAFAGFASDVTHAATSNTALASTALDNASNTAANLVNLTTSAANSTTVGGNGTVPQAEINTLANILAACVNSTGSSSSQCTTLFDNSPTTGVSPTNPTDTATAMLNIAHNPGANVASLFALQGSSPPFVPDLSAAPNDWTIAIAYTATPALNSPAGIAIDSSGDVWVTNNLGNSLTELGPNGIYGQTVTTGGLNGPFDVVIDGSGNLWVSNNGTGANSISEFNSSGTAITGSPFSGGGLSGPQGMAVDAQSHLWIANPGANILSEFNVTNGAAVSASGISTGGLNSPDAVAVDDNGDVWVTNSGGSGSLSVYTGLGAALGVSPLSGGGLSGPRWVAIDSNNNAWIANKTANVVSEFASTGVLSSSGYSGGGLNAANTIAVDAGDHVWVVNHSGNSLTELGPNGAAISPATTGFQGGSGASALNIPIDLAIDLDGNIWVTNAGNNTVTEFIGVATPLVTPIAANIITGHGYGDSAVNRP